MPRTLPALLHDRAELQHGVVTRSQALACGMSARQVDWAVASGRWTRLHPGVFLVRPLAPDRWTSESAAVLAAGPGAVLSRWSVLHHAGLGRPPRVVDVDVPLVRRVAPLAGVRVHRALRVPDAAECWKWPPRTPFPHAVIDVTAASAPDAAVALAALACQRGLTWDGELLEELARRGRHPHRTLLREALGDIGDGAQSTLEVRFLRDVVRAHRLPTPRLQARTVAGTHDAAFDAERVLVELDGQAYHADPAARRSDARRDRRSAGAGWLTVRAGWLDAATQPCSTASEVAAVLGDRGWADRPRRCRRRGCTVLH